MVWKLREKAQKLGQLQVKIYWQHDRSQKSLAFPLTFYLIKVGLGHINKNQLECEQNAIKYWYLLLTNHCELNLYLG